MNDRFSEQSSELGPSIFSSAAQAQLTDAQRRAATAAFHASWMGETRVFVLVRDIPENDLEPNPRVHGAFMLKVNSPTEATSRAVVRNFGLRPVVLQRKGSGSYEGLATRTKRNHDLIILTPQDTGIAPSSAYALNKSI